eukprot:3595124-Rhodomonas_salina.2
MLLRKACYPPTRSPLCSYAKSGTDLGWPRCENPWQHAKTQEGACSYAKGNCRQRSGLFNYQVQSKEKTLSVYARAMRCPVLRQRAVYGTDCCVVLRGAAVLHVRVLPPTGPRTTPLLALHPRDLVQHSNWY